MAFFTFEHDDIVKSLALLLISIDILSRHMKYSRDV